MYLNKIIFEKDLLINLTGKQTVGGVIIVFKFTECW